MNILSIDTSTQFLTLAVTRSGKLSASLRTPSQQRLSAILIPSIKKVLKKSRLSLSDINGICVGIGPGSFTGLRVGVAAVKGLALALKKPVAAVCSLDIIARNTISKSEAVCVLVDARRGNVFIRLYDYDNSTFKARTKPLLLPIADAVKKITRKTVFIGDGIVSFRPFIEKHKKNYAVFAPEKDWYPTSIGLAQAAIEEFKKKRTINPGTLVPLYLYPKDCQVNQKRRRTSV